MSTPLYARRSQTVGMAATFSNAFRCLQTAVIMTMPKAKRMLWLHDRHPVAQVGQPRSVGTSARANVQNVARGYS